MIFNLPPICGLFPLLLYIVLSFRKGMHPLVNVSICAVVGAILVKQPLGGLGAVIYESMGSFLPSSALSSCSAPASAWCCARPASPPPSSTF